MRRLSRRKERGPGGFAETSATHVPVAAATPYVLEHAVAGSAETETSYLISMPWSAAPFSGTRLKWVRARPGLTSCISVWRYSRRLVRRHHQQQHASILEERPTPKKGLLPTFVIGLIATGTDAACRAQLVRRAFAEALSFRNRTAASGDGIL